MARMTVGALVRSAVAALRKLSVRTTPRKTRTSSHDTRLSCASMGCSIFETYGFNNFATGPRTLSLCYLLDGIVAEIRGKCTRLQVERLTFSLTAVVCRRPRWRSERDGIARRNSQTPGWSRGCRDRAQNPGAAA